MAALDRWGYIERLAQAQQSGLAEEEAIVWARTRAFLDPDTQRWNAPGLGNTIGGISRDQTRRVRAIARALAVNPPPAETPSPVSPAPTDEALDSALLQPLDFSSPDPALPPTARPQAKAARKPQTAAAPEDVPSIPNGAVPTTQVLPPLSPRETDPALLEAAPREIPLMEGAQP
jgi:hypothetical protein